MTITIEALDGGIALVTLRNPARRNALDENMFRDLAAIWPRLEHCANTRCVVVTGEGEAFCSGADLSADLTSLPEIDALIDQALLKTHNFTKPVVAAIRGACVAGGFELALSCDIRLCSDDARLGLPEARWGIFPAGGGVLKLAAQIGQARASELLLTGRLFDAQEARAIGLVTTVVPAAMLLDRAVETARTIAANSPSAVNAIKRYLNAASTIAPDLRALEQALTDQVRQSADAREGSAAFLQKRAPDYAG